MEMLSRVLFLIGSSFFVLFIYSLFKQRNRLAAYFSVMCLSAAIYTIGYGFELQSDNLEQIKFFLKMEYFGVPFIPALWLLFAYKFYFKKSHNFQN